MKSNKLKIAMTGATGFVGGRTLQLLVDEGHEMTALVRDMERAKANYPKGVAFVQGDLANEAALNMLMQGADVTLHVAGAISAVNHAGFEAVNVLGTRAVVAAARRAGISRFVHVSSLAAREPHLSSYCATKAAGEAEVASIEGGMDWVIVRPPAVYGPGDKATLPLMQQLSRATAFLTGQADQRISVIHVADVATALLACVSSGVIAGSIYEIDDGKAGGYGWTDLANAAAVTTGQVPRLAFLPRFIVSIAGVLCDIWAKLSGRAQVLSRAKVNELYHSDWVIRGKKLSETKAWSAKIRFAEGFAETLQWYRQHGWLPQP